MSMDYDLRKFTGQHDGGPVDGHDNDREARNNVREALSAHHLMSGAGVSATVANRTHRVVRERANLMRARRSMVRSLWIPSLVCASLLMAICFAVWDVFDQYDVTPNGVPDSSQQLFVLILWSLPLSAAILALVWFKGSDTRTEFDGRNAR